jgi:hypothetical protein
VDPSATLAKKLGLLQRILFGALIYLLASALCFGVFLATNSFFCWLEDEPRHQSWRSLGVQSFLFPLALWAAFAGASFITRSSHRDGSKTAP